MQDLTEAFVELIRRAATQLPADMKKALREAKENEEVKASSSKYWENITARQKNITDRIAKTLFPWRNGVK